MAESILPYALTTLQRVKDRLTNAGATQSSDFDTVITRMINGCTDWVERECGGRRFVQTLYTNEIYSASGARQKRLALRQAPVFFSTITGNITLGNTTVSGLANTTGMVVGMRVMGDTIPAGTTIATIPGGTSITLSSAPTATTTGAYLQIVGLMSLQWRAGTPSVPSWMSFIVDQYELINDGRAGVIRIYGVFPRLYDNMIRATYSAGYPVNWANAGDNTTHLLPAQISDMVENLVVRRFKRRQLAGKGSEGLEASTTSWRDDIDSEDRAVIDQYRRMPTIF